VVPKNQNEDANNWWLYGAILVSVPVVFIIYVSILLYLTWPVSELSINKSGVFGDSFGALTALFSGLAFGGMIVTILLQSKELKLQRYEIRKSREEFRRSISAQERNARLAAIAALLEEYKNRLKINDEAFLRITDLSTKPAIALQEESLKIIEKRDRIIRELEGIILED
jgi:hypothetical protein